MTNRQIALKGDPENLQHFTQCQCLAPVMQMTKRLTDNQLSELKNLRARCALTLDLVAEDIGESGVVSEARSMVEWAFAEKKMKGLRQASKDIDDWAKGLSPSRMKELEERLKAQLGVDTQKEKALILAKIKTITDRAKIKNDSE